MNALPPSSRGRGSGMRATFVSLGMPVSIGMFFSLRILQLSSGLPPLVCEGLSANGVRAAQASQHAAALVSEEVVSAPHRRPVSRRPHARLRLRHAMCLTAALAS